jgi:hypothetical protein
MNPSMNTAAAALVRKMAAAVRALPQSQELWWYLNSSGTRACKPSSDQHHELAFQCNPQLRHKVKHASVYVPLLL